MQISHTLNILLFSISKKNFYKKQIELEIKQKIQEEIKVKLQERDLNFIQNPKLFFKKMLERFSSSIHLDRLLTNNNLLTNPEEIKTQIQYHFQNYYQEQPLSIISPNSEFYNLYKPYPEYEPCYENLLSKISNKEWSETISLLPNQKASGPSGLNYEHLKSLSTQSQNALQLLLSKCLQLQQIPLT